MLALDHLPVSNPPRDSYQGVVESDNPEAYWTLDDDPADAGAGTERSAATERPGGRTRRPAVQQPGRAHGWQATRISVTRGYRPRLTLVRCVVDTSTAGAIVGEELKSPFAAPPSPPPGCAATGDLGAFQTPDVGSTCRLHRRVLVQPRVRRAIRAGTCSWPARTAHRGHKAVANVP